MGKRTDNDGQAELEAIKLREALDRAVSAFAKTCPPVPEDMPEDHLVRAVPLVAKFQVLVPDADGQLIQEVMVEHGYNYIYTESGFAWRVGKA